MLQGSNSHFPFFCRQILFVIRSYTVLMGDGTARINNGPAARMFKGSPPFQGFPGSLGQAKYEC